MVSTRPLNPTLNKQVFAADGSGRPRTLRTALVIGGLLLGLWLTALALGIFGGFGALPVLDLGGGDQAQVAKTSSAPVQAPAGAVGDPASPSHKQSANKTTSAAKSGHGQSTTAPRGKPAGSGTGTGSGKPIGTPGNGGTNGGGNGNGKAVGLAN